MSNINFIDFKNNMINCANKPENRNEDGSVNWNFVESDMYIDHSMEDKHHGAFDEIATSFESK